MKIPTLLGLLILLLVSAGVVFGETLLSKNLPKPQPEVQPVNIEINNLNSDSVTVTWQTSLPTTTEARVAADDRASRVLQDLKDNRDSGTPETRLTHIVTINKLPSNTPTFFKININGKSYPSEALKITPLSHAPGQFTNFSPIVGSVVKSDLQPESDALVFLLVQNAYPLAAGVGQNGNFILPITQLNFKSDPAIKSTNPEPNTITGTLIIQKGDQKSEVEINITQDSQPLPPIVLGQNFNLR